MHSSRQKPPLAQLFRAPLLWEGDAALRWGRFNAPLSVGLFQSSPRFSFYPSMMESSFKNGALAKLRPPKNAFPKQKHRFPKRPSSSIFARELIVRKWTLPSMRNLASS